MKTEFLKKVKLMFAPAALAIAMAAITPAAALAENHGGWGGRGGGYRGEHSHSDWGRGDHDGGRQYRGGRGYYGGGYWGGRGYYRPGFGFGVGIYANPGYGYGYAAPVCAPAGFYDRAGYWHYYPGCAVRPYGY